MTLLLSLARLYLPIAIILITKTHLFKYTENFTTKNWIFSDKKNLIFSYFSSKYRLWVLLRTARRGGSNEYPQSMFLSRNKKNNVYPCKPQFYYTKKGGLGGSKLYRHVFVMIHNHSGLTVRKHIFERMRAAKAQISLRIRADWSGPSLSTNRIVGHNKMYEWKANVRIKLCACVGHI